MPLHCIIVDDEPRAHTILKHYIDKLPDLHLAASCTNVKEAHHFLEQNHADIILLDINMPELDGFALLELSGTKAAVIFTTAYTDHAFKSYDYNAVDYLHKPIRFERFATAIDKACKWKKIDTEQPAPDTITIKADGSNIQIRTADILFTESLGNYVKIYCTNAKYMTLITTKELQSLLYSATFARIHKSYIVNLSKITHWSKDLVYIGAHSIPVGKTYKIYLEEQLREYHK